MKSWGDYYDFEGDPSLKGAADDAEVVLLQYSNFVNKIKDAFEQNKELFKTSETLTFILEAAGEDDNILKAMRDYRAYHLEDYNV